MANINHKPSMYSPNLLHILPAWSDRQNFVLNTIIETNSWSINKYELITETWHLKLDRVWYSSLHYPFTYWAIPYTWDLDNDPLDIEIVNIQEPLVPWSLVEARVIWVMKFEDWWETDDKIIAVLHSDKRSDHIKSYKDLWEYFVKETTYYREHYKDLKKPWTCKVLWFFDKDEAMKIIDECVKRYEEYYKPKLS